MSTIRMTKCATRTCLFKEAQTCTCHSDASELQFENQKQKLLPLRKSFRSIASNRCGVTTHENSAYNAVKEGQFLNLFELKQ